MKVLCNKAWASQVKNFTGIDSPYKAPNYPKIIVNTIELCTEDTPNPAVSNISLVFYRQAFVFFRTLNFKFQNFFAD